jgi:prevent-host-death family protein
MEVLQVSSEQLRRQLSELLNQVSYNDVQIVIERYGKPIAVLSPYTQPESSLEEPEELFMPAEEVAKLARQIEKEVQVAGIDYDRLAADLQTERLKTVREKYPEFVERYVPKGRAMTYQELVKTVKTLPLEQRLLLLEELAHALRITLRTPPEAEQDDWGRLSVQGLSAAYSEHEPEYPVSLIKEPNPTYEGK